MSEKELKPCPFRVGGDWCDDFDGPCARHQGNRCDVADQLDKRDARIAALEEAIRKRCRNCWAKDATDAAQCRLCGLKKALKGTRDS